MQIIKTKSGSLVGKEYEGYTAYLGIPYAQPPVGDLRWRAPRRPKPWDGIMQATEFPAREHQLAQLPDSFYGKEFYSDPAYLPPMSEDCLYLNIWAPEQKAGEKYPVAFWIHGGAFMHGFGSEMEFDGEAFCRRGVILVTINYRVGAFGFLCHPALAADDPNGRCGNYGLMDQIAALKWVSENIEAFGGDKERIVIMGQSAGAMSVQMLCSSPLAKGLFHGAIMQSGGGYGNGFGLCRSQAEAEETGSVFSELAGTLTAEGLRKLSPRDIMNTTIALMQSGKVPGLPFGPVVDNFVLPAGSDACLDAGQEHDVDYMLGSNKNDMGVTEEMLWSGNRGPLWRGCFDFAAVRKAHGGKTYVYSFDRQLPGDDSGAFHSAELWYIFGTLGRCWRMMTPGDYRLSSVMTDYWCSFIKNGDPNTSGLPRWEPCSGDEDDVMIFDV
ncbi:MAG: carboxylesterase family protein [Clostridia bacterium]|nr:carboxylesterase family protein [Clostridia bacterium]